MKGKFIVWGDAVVWVADDTEVEPGSIIGSHLSICQADIDVDERLWKRLAKKIAASLNENPKLGAAVAAKAIR